ncbi:hypothetical protein GCM10010412_099630 [Nonomuraea recticatena]|uniref:Uncharacterized protein n=1 Tax=Nonomuraea recticatena TaxID=46178 RepID=A0ABP6FX76_9ACTN
MDLHHQQNLVDHITVVRVDSPGARPHRPSQQDPGDHQRYPAAMRHKPDTAIWALAFQPSHG